jgi:hypothetical protein
LPYARLRTLEVGVKRTKAEIRGERQEKQGVSVDGLLDAYLAERTGLGSKGPPRGDLPRFDSLQERGAVEIRERAYHFPYEESPKSHIVDSRLYRPPR